MKPFCQLQVACSRSLEETKKIIETCEIDLNNVPLNYTWFPVCIATIHKKRDIVEYLINCGAYTNVSIGPYSPLVLAIERKNMDIIRVISSHHTFFMSDLPDLIQFSREICFVEGEQFFIDQLVKPLFDLHVFPPIIHHHIRSFF